jgi:hypothetical protein
MNNSTKLAPHEMLEVNDILRSEMVVTKKLQVSMPMIADPELRQFAEDSLKIQKDILSRYEAFFAPSQQRQ